MHLSPEEKDADAVLNTLRASYLKRFAAQPDLPFRPPFASTRPAACNGAWPPERAVN